MPCGGHHWLGQVTKIHSHSHSSHVGRVEEKGRSSSQKEGSQFSREEDAGKIIKCVCLRVTLGRLNHLGW